MIAHECIHCDHLTFIILASNAPCFQEVVCGKCGTLQYLYHSKVAPASYLPEMLIIDKEKRAIKIKEEYK